MSLIEDEIETLKVILERQGYDSGDGEYEPSEVKSLGQAFDLPQAYVDLLIALEPSGTEIRYGDRQSLIFFPFEELDEAQEAETLIYNGFVIGSINDQPLTLSLEDLDESKEDCPIYVCEEEESTQMASSLTQFIQILRITLEMLHSLEDYDDMSRWKEEQEENQGSYDNDFEEFSDEPSSREQLLEDYYQEVDDIDPDCIDAWRVSEAEMVVA